MVNNDIRDDPLLQKLFTERNIRHSTRRGYITTLTSYTAFHQLSLQALLQEAENDENKGIPLKNRKIKQRISKYRIYLNNEGIAANTIKNYISKVRTFYNHFEIELPNLPQFKYETNYQMNYTDLPSKDDIIKVLNHVPLDLKSIILFMVSSGTARAEALSLTVNDFITATEDYYDKKSDSIKKILNDLSSRNDIVPTFYIKRLKTDKFYYTFCSPEASSYIIKYLKTRDNLKKDDKLFPFTPPTLVKKFEDINDFFNWGFKGHYRYFRSHVLRKYHASNIGLPAEQVDMLEGRSKTKIHDTYIKTNPKELKKIYMGAMHNVMFLKETTEQDNLSSETESRKDITSTKEHVANLGLSQNTEILVIIGKLSQKIDDLEKEVHDMKIIIRGG